MADSLRRRSVAGGMWSLLQRWYAKIAALAAMIVLARILTPETYGLVALASVFIGLVGAFAELGLVPALVSTPRLDRRAYNTAFWTSLSISLVLAGLVFAASGPIATLLGHPELEPVIRALTLTFPLASLSTVQVAIATRNLDMRLLAIRHAIGITIGAAGGIALALMGAGVWALVFQTLTPSAFAVVFMWTTVPWRPAFEFSLADARALLKLGIPVLMAQFVNQLRDRGEELLIGALLGTQALGMWVVAVRLTRFATDLITSSVNAVALPALAMVRDDPPRLERAVRYAVRMSSFLVVPALVALAIMSPVLVPTVFGSQWALTGEVAQLVAIGAAVGAVQLLDSSIWIALGKPTVELVLVAIATVIHLAVVWLAVPQGLVVLAAAIAVKTLLLLPLRMTALRAIGRIPLTVYRDLPAVVASAVIMAGAMAGAAVLGATLPAIGLLCVEVAVGTLVYLAASLLLQRTVVFELVGSVRAALRRRRDP